MTNNLSTSNSKFSAEKIKTPELHFPQGDYSITVEEEIGNEDTTIRRPSQAQLQQQALIASGNINPNASIISNQSFKLQQLQQQQIQQQQIQQQIQQQQIQQQQFQQQPIQQQQTQQQQTQQQQQQLDQQQIQQLEKQRIQQILNMSLGSSMNLSGAKLARATSGGSLPPSSATPQMQQGFEQQQIQQTLNSSLNTSIHLPSSKNTATVLQQTGGALYESVDFPVATQQMNSAMTPGSRLNSINVGTALHDSVDFSIAQQTTTPVVSSSQQQKYTSALYESLDIPMAETHMNQRLNADGSVILPDMIIENVDVNDICQNNDDDVDEEAITKYLRQMDFPTGLIDTIIENRKSTAKHYWVIDNSGSMLQNDGLRLAMRKGNPPVIVPCTRWKELQQSVIHLAEMSGNIGYVTQFMLLNAPGLGVTQKKFTVGTNKKTLDDDLKTTKKLLNYQPDGVSLITKGLRSLLGELKALAPVVAEQGKKIYFVLATDGLPSDKFGQTSSSATEQLMETLREFESYPIFFVIRLCTTDAETVEFYNGLDQLLERNVEVITDVHSEAEEVFKVNQWINYALPLHWSREMGLRDRLFDMIDERELTKEEMANFLKLIFGEKAIDDLPDPLYDWKAFHAGLTQVVKNEGFVWDPVGKKLKHWIDLKALDKMYGGDGTSGGLRRSTDKTKKSSGDKRSGKGGTTVQADAGGCGCSIS